MHTHTCNCLNVRLDVLQLLAAPPAQLPEPLRSEPLLSDGCHWVLLGPDGARVEHAALLQKHVPKGAEHWAVHRCLNCGLMTHAVSDLSGAAAAVSKQLLSEPARIAALQQSLSYSPAFRVVLPQLAGRLERRLTSPVSARGHPALSAALRAAKLTLAAFVRKEEQRVEAAIQAFRDEKLTQLKESKQRALEESHVFTSLLLRVEDQLRLSDPDGGEGRAGEGDARAAETEGRDAARSQRAFRGHQDMVGVFLMDGDDVEVAEEADEHYASASVSADEELDTDDSGVEEPRPMAVPMRLNRAEDLATSLPVHIPVPASVRATGQQRRRDLDEETVPDIDQMGASIRQLAQSLHTEPGMCFDLPRPRTNTLHL